MTQSIQLPSGWLSGRRLEKALKESNFNPHRISDMDINFVFPVGCKVMVDAGIRLLSLANQLRHIGKRIKLIFEEGENGTFGYLDRLGFIDLLDTKIKTVPERPEFSSAEIYRGANPNIIEIAKINTGMSLAELPRKLETALVGAVNCRGECESLGNAAYTVFSELIDNITQHSETRLDGYAVFQVYQSGGRAKVAVSDSGLGIIETLRPGLKAEGHPMAGKSDIDLVVEAFRNGLSRHGGGRGCGLKASADNAIKYNAQLQVRLPMSYLILGPSSTGYQPHTMYAQENMPLVWGTHISFDFKID